MNLVFQNPKMFMLGLTHRKIDFSRNFLGQYLPINCNSTSGFTLTCCVNLKKKLVMEELVIALCIAFVGYTHTISCSMMPLLNFGYLPWADL